MPLEGEYAPGTSDWARKQAEAYATSRGEQADTLNGMPIVVLTTVGARSGKLRKTALMRVEHDGRYAVVASYGAKPQKPGLVPQPRREPARRAAGRRGHSRHGGP